MSPRKKSAVNITVAYETRKKGFLLKTRPSKFGRKGRRWRRRKRRKAEAEFPSGHKKLRNKCVIIKKK